MICVPHQVDLFLDNLINYDKDNIPETCLKAVAPYLADPEFEYENIKGKSFAAAGESISKELRNYSEKIKSLEIGIKKSIS